MKKIYIYITVSLLTFAAIFYFINSYLYKSKAAGETVTTTMVQDGDMNLAANVEKKITLTILPSSGKISGFDLNFDLDNLQITRFEAPAGVGSTNPFIFTNIATVSTNRIIYVIKDNSINLPLSISIAFYVKNTDGKQGTISLNTTTSQTVGNITGGIFGFNNQSQLIFNPGAIISTTPATSITPGGGGNTTLSFKLKFQGITDGLADAYKTMPVKITVKKGASTVAVAATSVNFTVDPAGIWTGSLTANMGSGTDYMILVKGPMHIQKKVCVVSPSETIGGTYSCAGGAITITSGTTNDLDFSKILFMAGDLPLSQTNGQDSVADAIDIGYIVNNLGKNDASISAVADLNRNAGVDMTDFGLIKYALSVASDEE